VAGGGEARAAQRRGSARVLSLFLYPPMSQFPQAEACCSNVSPPVAIYYQISSWWFLLNHSLWHVLLGCSCAPNDCHTTFARKMNKPVHKEGCFSSQSA